MNNFKQKVETQTYIFRIYLDLDLIHILKEYQSGDTKERLSYLGLGTYLKRSGYTPVPQTNRLDILDVQAYTQSRTVTSERLLDLVYLSASD